MHTQSQTQTLTGSGWASEYRQVKENNNNVCVPVISNSENADVAVLLQRMQLITSVMAAAHLHYEVSTKNVFL